MQAEIVTIGTELLLGDIVDTNSAWIAQQLTTIGLNLFYTVTVGDNRARIASILRTSLQRSDVVITTGGLGPTVDDMTREAAADATERELVFDETLEHEIACFFASRGRQMTANNRKQACRPAGSQVIHNPVGTAPAFAVEHNGHVIICLPGVPHEMRYLMEHEVLGYLRARLDLHSIIKSRVLRTCGIGESTLGAEIGDLMELGNPTVGTAAHPGQTDVRITAKADDEAEADRLIAPIERELRARVGAYIFGVDDETLSDVVARLLAERNLRLGLAEAGSEGELAQALGQTALASQVLAGGLVVPGNARLAEVLQLAASEELPADTLADAAAVADTAALADAAAVAVRKLFAADLGLATVAAQRPPQDATAGATPPVHLSLATGQEVLRATATMGRQGVSARGWLLHTALDLVRRHLLGL